MDYGRSWYRSSRQLYKWIHWIWCRVVCTHRYACDEWKNWKRIGFTIIKEEKLGKTVDIEN